MYASSGPRGGASTPQLRSQQNSQRPQALGQRARMASPFRAHSLGEHKPGRIKRAALSLQNQCFILFVF